jgi:glycosyltransferase involved in cell wall biosynthesis
MLVRNPFTHDSRVEKEARSLTGAGYAVTVVAEAGPGLPMREERDGYEVRRVARPSTRMRGVRLLAHLRGLEAELIATAPDILHAHDSDALTPVARAARRLGVPFVLDAHELWLGRQPRGRGWLYRTLFVAYYRVVERRFVRRAAAHITVSPVIARYLERRYHVGPVVLVPNYPEVAEAERAIELRSLPGAEGVPADAPVVLHIGSAMPGRGVEQVIEAMAAVPQAHLVLLGPGPAAAGLLQLAATMRVGQRVHVIAAVPTDDVIAVASSATVGVAPIIGDTPNNAASMPNKLFQYLAAGLPVVVSDLPQLRRIVEESACGIAVESGDPGAIGRALRDLLADPERLAEQGRRARTAVEERYNWGVSAAALLEVYARLPV